jgi:hypothetical protein
MIINDLLDGKVETLLIDYGWGIPLITCVNNLCGQNVLGVDTRVCDVKVFLRKEAATMQFEVLSKEITEYDEHTSGIWRKLQQVGLPDYLKAKAEKEKSIYSPALIILLLLLFLVVTKVSFDYVMTGEVDLALLEVVIKAILSTMGYNAPAP